MTDAEWIIVMQVAVQMGGLVRNAGLFLAVALVFVCSRLSAQEDVVHYKASMDNVKATFGPAEPVVHVKPGGTLEANSLDCFGNALQKPGDPFSLIKIDNPLTGPFFIDGAEPGDTLVVHKIGRAHV